jgi:hypothetical protein
MKIYVHIERLVLEGLPYERRDATRMRAALEAELAGLVARTPTVGLLAQGGAVDRIQAVPVALGPLSAAESVGREIAGSVYEGLRG